MFSKKVIIFKLFYDKIIKILKGKDLNMVKYYIGLNLCNYLAGREIFLCNGEIFDNSVSLMEENVDSKFKDRNKNRDFLKNKDGDNFFCKRVYCEIEHIIKEAIEDNSDINFSKIQDIMFPSGINYDIFISHSHSDKYLAKELSNNLKGIGITSFIDSDIWKNVDDLKKYFIKDVCYDWFEYERCREKYEYYHKIHMAIDIILATALSNVLHSSRYFVFIETSNSRNSNEKTYSSWVYFENQVAQKIFTKNLRNVSEKKGNHLFFSALEHFKSSFNTNYDFLDKVRSVSDILQYIKECDGL